VHQQQAGAAGGDEGQQAGVAPARGDVVDAVGPLVERAPRRVRAPGVDGQGGLGAAAQGAQGRQQARLLPAGGTGSAPGREEAAPRSSSSAPAASVARPASMAAPASGWREAA